MSKLPPSETIGADGGPADLSPRPRSLREAAFEARKRAEGQIILAALDEHRWNRRRAAKALNISYRSLMYKMKDYGLRDGGPVSATEVKDETTGA
jgi:DNA-binding NtrC family response regulator